MAPPRLFALHALAFVAPLMLLVQAASTVHQSTGDRTITQVVKLLQGMLEKSKDEGIAERDIFAKKKCLLDTAEEEKKKEIEDLTKQIGLLENDIEKLLASTGMASTELAQTKRDIVSTTETRQAAKSLRDQQKQEFGALNTSLTEAIGQLKEAIQVLADVGADQTDGHSAREVTQYLSDYEKVRKKKNLSAPLNLPPSARLAELGATVKKALVASVSLAGASQARVLESLLQAPFTGTYSAQSGEVVGILKEMRDTFRANRQEAMTTEKNAQKAWEALDQTLADKLETLRGQETDLQTKVAENDGNLATKKSQKQIAEESLSSAQTYLAAALTERESETKKYNLRVELRTKEDAALAEAISILNSDAAFATFGTVDATRTGPTSFLQYQSISPHRVADDSRQRAQTLLRKAASAQHAPLLGRIAALLQANNPFDVVLKEIQKMIDLIAAEEQADADQKQWCDDTRGETRDSIQNKHDEILRLTGVIDDLTSQITDPTTGLQAQIADSEETLQTARQDSAKKTEIRQEENLVYQKDIANLVDADALLQRAIVVLRQYYSKIDKQISSSLLQRRAEPEFQSVFSDKYTGQSESGKSVIDQLEFILKGSQDEEKQAHQDELSAQHTFEDDMASFRQLEESTVAALGRLQADLALKTQQLKMKGKERDTTSKEKAALEVYLEKIKPGCDFITTNIEQRIDNRAEETRALQQAKGFLEGSPVYVAAVAQAHDELLGDCLGICKKEGEDRVECIACLKKTSVPGYCAGHPTTAGC